MRVFLAIDLPSKVKADLENQLTEIKREYPMVDWIPSKNYHVTINFFGEIDNDNKNKIVNRLKEFFFDKKTFYLYSTIAGLFINKKIIIYLNFRKEKELLSIEQQISQKKTGYFPHLTLARYRIPSKQQYFVLKKRVKKLKIDIFFPVKKTYLFQTLPHGKFPVYKKISQFNLLP